jgi:hypothetical protein
MAVIVPDSISTHTSSQLFVDRFSFVKLIIRVSMIYVCYFQGFDMSVRYTMATSKPNSEGGPT